MRKKQKELLLQLRSMLVGKLHTQPFTIYNDETIEHLLDAQPKTLKELSMVKGFPENGKRIKGFGDAIIAIFSNCNKIDSFQVTGDSEEDISIGTKLKKIEAF